jgi:tripartite-type tricarboxylate transporter receptor subunit TctC
MKAASLFVVGILSAAVAPNALADTYPTKPIRLIAPFPPGGGTDLLARVIAIPMTELLGEAIVVDNRPGAGGAIGAEIAARAEADGYTFILVSGSHTATQASRRALEQGAVENTAFR